MRYIETIETLKSIPGWEFVTSFSVGGFEWLAFSEKCPTKLLIISSQKATIVDVDTGTINDCNVEYETLDNNMTSVRFISNNNS